MKLSSTDGKTCFVLMPISDPQGYDSGHFTAVYQHIICPACEQAGFRPIRADDINQTNYIALDVLRWLVEADMAVCDISARNPNVLYELGIRHAVRKPVVLLKDNRTDRVFDIQGIRDTPYDASLRIDRIAPVIDKIADALTQTFAAGENDTNSLMQLIELGRHTPSGGTIQALDQGADGFAASSAAMKREAKNQMVGIVDFWNETREVGFGFIRTDTEEFYFNPQFMAQENTPASGDIAFFVPMTSLEPGEDA